MIIRESPSPRKAADTVWPPKSAHQAQLASPTGRKRAQRVSSPSPSKRPRLSSQDAQSDGDGEEDDDEETVQLKLQAIEARLKLKKLQKAKLKKLSNDAGNTVEVPHSPKPQRDKPVAPPVSPRRIQLGIDKGLRAADVSLKKARSSVHPPTKHDSTRNGHKSFSERLAESRSQDLSRQEKEDRRVNKRSQGFGINQATAAEKPNHDRNSQHTLLSAGNNTVRATTPNDVPPASLAAGANSLAYQDLEMAQSGQEASDEFDPFSGFTLSRRKTDHSALEKAFEGKTLISIRKLLKTVTAPHYEPPDIDDDYVVLGVVASKSLPRNHISEHQTKSDADPNEDNNLPSRSKFMVLRLVDLKWELDLFLFGTAFDRFWKLTVGTVLAILNPGIMPPKPHMRDTGQFSLKVSSSEDMLLEIGMSKDLGFCKSVKKDGKECAQWIDGRKTEFCDFHVNLRVEKAKSQRMEINGMVGSRLFGNNARNGKRGRGQGRGRGRGNGLSREGAYYDRNAGEIAYSIPREFRSGINTARMLDSEDYLQGGMSKAERSRKRLAEAEKERNLARALGTHGDGQGREYMRLKQSDKDDGNSDKQHEAAEDPTDAVSLGLVGVSAQAVKLSPANKKGRRGGDPLADPMGWGGAFKRGLLSPSRKANAPVARVATSMSSEKPPTGDISPTKQARFLLEEKGIRLPGRESVGTNARRPLDDDDDDGLDIV